MVRKRKLNEEKDPEEDKSFKIVFSGIVLILLVSFMEGFGPAFTRMITHFQEDIIEWAIHLYILGWALILYGFYRLSRGK